MLKGYRTVILNILLAIIPALDGMDVTHILSPAGQSVYTCIVPIANIILRFYTTSPIFNKDANAGAS